jgi:3D (Asp-Asp-Asp) domain-containing protein
MKRFLACLATLACALAASSGAYAEPASPTSPVKADQAPIPGQAATPPQNQAPSQSPAPTPAATPAKPAADPIGDLVTSAITGSLPGSADYYLRATLYHAGERGLSALDSLGCKVVAAVDGIDLPRHTILFIKETVGLPMPDGSRHDGFWYASDVGGAIHKGRIDLFTGSGRGSMSPLMPLNLATLTVMKAGVFHGCPPN